MAEYPIVTLASLQDSALMRPGRLDRILYVGPPEREARKEIWSVRMSKMEQIDPEVDVDQLADLVSRRPSRQACFLITALLVEHRRKVVRVPRSRRYARKRQWRRCTRIYSHLSYVSQSFSIPGTNKQSASVKIPMRLFVKASKEMRRGITEDMIQGYEEWRDRGVSVGVKTE